MAHPATKKFSYAGQAGILLCCIGIGLVLGGMLSFLPLLGHMDLFGSKKESMEQMMNKLLKPENASMLRWMQFISTLFMFFIPALAYARICHRKPFVHLGLNERPVLREVFLMLLLVFAAVPAASLFQDLTMQLPWSSEMLAKFKAAEEAYNKQVAVLVNMRNFGDYLLSLVIIAFLPALFEEVLFRGAMQNLLSRWLKWPMTAIVITAFIFSAIHGSYVGFLSRFVLGIVLGWIFYRSGKLWLNVLAHFLNNALAATAMFLSVQRGKPPMPDAIEEEFPLWVGFLGLAALVVLFIFFERVLGPRIYRPGQEVALSIPDDSNNPFADNANMHQAPEHAPEPPGI